MSALERQAHWWNVHQTRHQQEVSLFQASSAISLELVRATGVGSGMAIIDIGAGASRLADGLVTEGCRSVTVLDVSERP